MISTVTKLAVLVSVSLEKRALQFTSQAVYGTQGFGHGKGGGTPLVGPQALRMMDDGKEGAGWYTVVFLRESYRTSLTESMGLARTTCDSNAYVVDGTRGGNDFVATHGGGWSPWV